MEITFRLNTQYGAHVGCNRVSDIRVLRALADAIDETPANVSIHAASHNAERAVDNCMLAENVASVTGIDVDAPFADVKGDEKATTEPTADDQTFVEGKADGVHPELMKEEQGRVDAASEVVKPAKRKRRTKKEMEAARAAEAETPNSIPVDDAIDAALSTLDDAVGTDVETEATKPAPSTVPDEVDPAKAMRDIMVKFVNRFQSQGTLIMAKIVEDLTGETNILKVSKENFGPVFDALTARLDADDDPVDADDDPVDDKKEAAPEETGGDLEY